MKERLVVHRDPDGFVILIHETKHDEEPLYVVTGSWPLGRYDALELRCGDFFDELEG